MAKEWDPTIGSVQPIDCNSWKKRYTTSGGYTYRGYAMPGTPTSSAGWRIERKNDTTKDVDHANGRSSFENIWDNVLSLTYS